jgi:hypothetical protein
MLILPPTDLPGNTHTTGANPVCVKRAAYYRLSWAAVIEAADPRHGPLTGVFAPEYRPHSTFGLAGLESQEHSVLWIGDPAPIAAMTGPQPIRIPWDVLGTTGLRTDRWPSTNAWLEFVPPGTWNPGGEGIVAEYDFEGFRVVVYEIIGRPALLTPGARTSPGGPVPTVTFHCTRCHLAADEHDRHQSASPDDRRAACQAARRHMRPGNCAGAAGTARCDEMVAVVQQAVAGRPRPASTAGLYASQCSTSSTDPATFHAGSCAEVRVARTRTAAHTRKGGGQ